MYCKNVDIVTSKNLSTARKTKKKNCVVAHCTSPFLLKPGSLASGDPIRGPQCPSPQAFA